MLEVSVSESGKRENDQIVFLFRIAQEDAAVGIHQLHARIGIRTIRMQLRAEFQDHRIDLDRGDLLNALRQRRRGVGAGPRAEDQRVLERSAGKQIRTPAGKTAPYSATGSCSDARCC